jgi:hypothetical protein
MVTVGDAPHKTASRGPHEIGNAPAGATADFTPPGSFFGERPFTAGGNVRVGDDGGVITHGVRSPARVQ